jgi:hypothetical protein
MGPPYRYLIVIHVYINGTYVSCVVSHLEVSRPSRLPLILNTLASLISYPLESSDPAQMRSMLRHRAQPPGAPPWPPLDIRQTIELIDRVWESMPAPDMLASSRLSGGILEWRIMSATPDLYPF